MNNKGINLIALIILIIVMIILAGIAISNSTDSYTKSLEAKAKEENNQVRTAINARFGNFNISPSSSPLIGKQVPYDESEELDVEAIKNYLVSYYKSKGKLATEDELNNKTTENEIDYFVKRNKEDMEYTRLLEHSDIVALDIESISLDSEFIVNYYTGMVVGPIQ